LNHKNLSIFLIRPVILLVSAIIVGGLTCSAGHVEMPCGSMAQDAPPGFFDCGLPRSARSSLLRMTGIGCQCSFRVFSFSALPRPHPARSNQLSDGVLVKLVHLAVEIPRFALISEKEIRAIC